MYATVLSESIEGGNKTFTLALTRDSRFQIQRDHLPKGTKLGDTLDVKFEIVKKNTEYDYPQGY